MRSRFDPRRLTDPYAFLPLGVLIAVSAVDGWDIAAFSVLTPEIRHTFHLSLAGIGVIAALVAPISILMTLPIAFLGDRRRRTTISAIGLTVWAAATGLTGIAPVTAILVIGRMFARVGSDADTVHKSLLSDYYPPSHRSTAFFSYDLGGTVGFLLSPVVAGFLSDWIGWRATFLVIIPVALVVVVFVRRLPEPRRGELDRLSEGVAEDVAALEEEPAGFGETFRVLRSYPAAMWVYVSIPLRIGAFSAVGLIYSTYLHDEFGLGARGRGIVIGFDAPFTIVSILVTGIIVQRWVKRDQLRRAALALIALDVFTDFTVLLMVVAPNLAFALVGNYLTTLFAAGIDIGFAVVMSMLVPPRMRTLAFASGALWAVLAVPMLPAAGALADTHGTRLAIAAFIPIALLGSFCLYMATRTLDLGVARSRSDAVNRVLYRRKRSLGDPVLLSVGDVVVELGGSTILDHVAFDLADGEIVALLGTNGAGKTTLMRALTGLVTPTSGTLIFDGIELGGADPAKTFRLGMAYAPGAPYLYDGLTVAENLQAAGWAQRGDRAGLRAAIDETLDVLPSLRARLDVRAGELSGGERQLVNLAQALLSRPRLLLIDELTLGLSPAASETVLDAVRSINASGVTIIFVEQSVDRALRLAERAIYIDRGAVQYDGPTSELRNNPDVLRAAFFGDAPRRRRRAIASGESVLRGEAISLHYGGVTAVDAVDIDVAAGEIVALVGPNGAGKTSLLDVLAGAARADVGTITFDGRDVTRLAADARARLGLGRSFQDARLWPALTVREAIATARERHVAEPALAAALVGLPASKASEVDVASAVARLLDEFGLAPFAERFVGELSTGMRRTLELACLMAAEPSVLLLDEPAAGLAQREIPGMAERLLSVHERSGAAMVIVEHDLPLVRQVAQRVIVMADGKVIANGDPRKVFDLPQVQEAYFAGVAAAAKH